jgi:hypothetical protein
VLTEVGGSGGLWQVGKKRRMETMKAILQATLAAVLSGILVGVLLKKKVTEATSGA